MRQLLLLAFTSAVIAVPTRVVDDSPTFIENEDLITITNKEDLTRNALPVLRNSQDNDGMKVVHDDTWLERRRAYIQGTADWQPRHVHLALGHETDEMVVTWSTLSNTSESIVEFGLEMFDLNMNATGTSTRFVDQGWTKSTQYIHRVHLRELQPDTAYYYHVGSPDGWSSAFAFRTVPGGGEGWPLKVAVLGDLGAMNARSLNTLQHEAHQGKYSAIVHLGDFGYDLNDEEGRVGDIFMEQIQPVAGYIPYMVAPGNHERHYDFLHYINRFTMPNYTETQNIGFSFNIGPVHFISLSTEVYYYEDIEARVKRQYEWLVADLEIAKRERSERPWIVVYGHRPMYCSNTNTSDFDCMKVDSVTRTGLKPDNRYALEPLLHEYSVDMFMAGHEHSYERFYPVYNYTIGKGSEEEPYNNPRATVHITTGSAGCRELLKPFKKDQPEWSAQRFSEYGFTRLTFLNHSHLHFEMYSDERSEVVDSMMLIRDQHNHF